MKRINKAISVLLIITLVFSFNIVSLSYPELKLLLGNLFSINAYAVDDVIAGYAPSGTRDLAVDASVTASSSYTSGDGHWELARINDGAMTYNSGPNGYNGEAAYSSSPDEVYFDNNSMTQAEKDAAVAESKTKPLTIDFDLEGFYDISRVTLFHIASFPDTFDIQTSTDGKTYNAVATESGHTGFNQEALSVDFNTTRARFVRIYVTVRGNLEGNYIHLVQFKEIAVFGKEVAPTNSGLEINTYAPENCINLAIDSKVTASESYEEGNKWGVHKINDGDTSRNGTGYTSESANRDMNIAFNLGNIAEIKRIVYFPCGGVSPKTFKIQTSFDGITYNTVSTHSTTTAYAPGPLVYDLPETTFASYVRIYVEERYASDGYYVQIAELAIYGIKNAYDAQPSKTKVKLTPGDTLQLDWIVKNLNSFDRYNHNVVWSSSNTSVATVSSNGLITAKAVGNTTVRIENTTIGYYAEVNVNVYTTIPFARDEMTVSIFAPPLGDLFTDEQYQRLAAADVDLILNTYNVYKTEDNLALIEMADKYGMNTIAADMRFRSDITNLSQEIIDEVYADYKGLSNLEGFYVYDEPWNANDYVNTVNKLEATYPGSLQYLNFFPGFAYTSLEQYEYILEDWAILTNGNSELMFDVYPFMQDGSTNYNRLFDSLDVIRRVGLDHNVNTAGCIQTIGYGPVGGPLTNRIPYESDIRYQNMAYLAYGIKHVAYWKYSAEESNGMEEYSVCPIDENGNPTNVYYYMQRINPIVHTLGKTLINCDAKEVYLTGSNTFGQKPVPSGFFVQPGNTSQSLIFSYLQDKNTGRNYLMVVNNDLSASVTAPLKFASGINSVEILNNDTGAWTTNSVSGNYNVNLLPGGAALIALPSSYRYSGTTVTETGVTNEFYHKPVTGNSSLGTPGIRDQGLPGWYFNALTDGYILSNSTKGINGWCSEQKASSFNTWVQIDLGVQKSISSVTLHAVDELTGYTGYFPKSYTISVSTNGTSWTPVASATNSTTTDEVTHPFSAKNARYIRVNITDMNAIDGLYAAALSEIETDGYPRISDYTVVAEDTNGYYVYSRCENVNYVRVPSWTELNGQDDLGEWYESEKGSWTIDGRNYNFRSYIPVSKHNNERGNYISHIYAYKNDSVYTAVATGFNFDLKLSFDLNYGNIPKNLLNNLNNISGGSGVTASYNATEDTITLNGTLSGSINLQYSAPIVDKIKKGDKLRVIMEPVSGSMSNSIIVLELFDSNLANPGGIRHVADIVGAGVYDIPVTTDKAAKDITTYKLWLYKDDNKTTTFNNYKFRIKLEIYNGTDPAYSPSGKTVPYGAQAGTLPTVTRSDAEFLGWFTEPINGVQVVPTTPNDITNSLTLFAHWAPYPININYEQNIPSGATPTSASNMPSTGKLTYNSTFTLPTTIPQMAGYIFQGWATTPDVVSGETVYQPGAAFDVNTVNSFFNQVNAEAKIYARWAPITYKVIFRGNENNGGNDVPSHTMTYDVEARLNLNTYTKTGYTFKNWNIASNGSAESFVDGQTVKNLTCENGKEVNLYAQWTVNKYTIIFDGNGHTGGSMSNLEMSYDVAANLTANSFIKNGADFVCWNTKPDGSGTNYTDRQSVVKLSEINGATITLYAIWSSYPEVIFGNEFDFDKFYCDSFAHSSTGYFENSKDFIVNKLNNSLTITANDKSTDSFTIPYDNPSGGATNLYAMNLIPGRTYELSCKCENLKNIPAPVRILTFFYDNPNLSSFQAQTNIFETVGENSTDVFSVTFTVPEGRPYMTIRFGLCDKNNVPAANTSVRLSDICVRDVTNFADTSVKDDVTKPSVLSKNSSPENNYTISDFPTLTRTGYTFLGWSKTRGADGNGVLTDRVESYTFTATEINNSTNRTLYPIWAPNVVIAKFNTGISSIDSFMQDYYYGKSQPIKSVENATFTVSYYDGDKNCNSDQTVSVNLLGWSDTKDSEIKYSPSQTIMNPNGKIGVSNDRNDANVVTTQLYAKWSNNGNTVKAQLAQKENYVLAGWSETQGSITAEYPVGATITPTKDMTLYAVWISLADFDNQIDIYDETYSEQRNDIVSGIIINADGTVSKYSEITAIGHLKYDRDKLDAAIKEYDSAKKAFSDKTVSSNNSLVSAIRNLESVVSVAPELSEDIVKDYLSDFEIRFAEGVTETVPEGRHSVADMNLNHYQFSNLNAAKDALTQGKSATTQSDVNAQLIILAQSFANVEDVKTSTPEFNVYDTATSIMGSGLINSNDVKAMNYVYTGKGNYTYYCYTNSKTPTMLISIDEVTGIDNRTCYPTKADVIKSEVTLNAIAGSEVIVKKADNASDYSNYLNAGMGTKLTQEYYISKDVVQLTPDFTNANDKATVSYTIKARDDAYAGLNDETPNYANSAVLASGADSGDLSTGITRPDTTVTPENTITIIIDYHDGEAFNVTSDQVNQDQWLKQYHLFRTSGGASNWELPMPGDSVYKVNDETYGQKDYGSFTYTFNVGTGNDFANCVLGLSGAENFDAEGKLKVDKVIEIVKENHKDLSKVAFTGTNTTNGTGLGYHTWPNGTWSYNYYPQSQAYTYVHLVDRWGNTVDKVIEVPNLDPNAVKVTTQSAGDVKVFETGGSGIDTMSFSAKSFEIIADENSMFDGETYTTTGNTVKVYTGEANKQYTLVANDAATNKTTANVTTDAEGYLTITVEDEAFDTTSGMYTFSLNGTQINLYGEVTVEPERGVTNVEYTPSTSTRNMFMFTVIGRPDKIQVIEPDGGTRTYDRYHAKVVIVSYDENGNVIESMSRELCYEIWTIEMNIPAEKELTAIARYGREWSKEAPYKYTVILATPEFDDEVYSMTLAATEGWQGKVEATVVTGLDVQGVRFVMDNNTTTTYYTATEADGKLTYVGNAWMNHSGENIIIVKIRVNNAWLNAGELNYNAI